MLAKDSFSDLKAGMRGHITYVQGDGYLHFQPDGHDFTRVMGSRNVRKMDTLDLILDSLDQVEG